MMTRYERVSTDCLPLSNGKKSNNENGRSITNGLMNSTTTTSTTTSTTTTTSSETKGFTFKSSLSRSQDHHHHHHHHHNASSSSPPHSEASPNPKDLFLQWGQKKRARVSRSEIRSLADESSSSAQAKLSINKLPRRADSKLSTPAMLPPPPPPPPPQQHSSNNNISNSGKGGNFRSSLSHRILEKRSGAETVSPSRNNGGSTSRGVSRSTAGKRSPPTPEKIDKKIPNSTKPPKCEKPNGSMSQPDTDPTPPQSEQEPVFNVNTHTPTTVEDKLNAEAIEWPRILLSLSRKEKEDDFFAMKGTKLPQRPKKRAKNIDKTLQYCFPGMWLSDLTRSRYEVREKKCSVKKQQKRRGLKGMESIDYESE